MKIPPPHFRFSTQTKLFYKIIKLEAPKWTPGQKVFRVKPHLKKLHYPKQTHTQNNQTAVMYYVADSLPFK